MARIQSSVSEVNYDRSKNRQIGPVFIFLPSLGHRIQEVSSYCEQCHCVPHVTQVIEYREKQIDIPFYQVIMQSVFMIRKRNLPEK
jgi:hypothetical protein